MADSKYATLPGIAYDQPDVYESEDLTDCNESSCAHEQSDDLEKLSTNVKDSFTKFNDSWIYPGSANSKETMLCGKLKQKPWNGPYELQAAGEKETLLQKFNRLKCEVTELEKDLIDSKVSEDGSSTIANELITQTAVLHKQLVSLKISNKNTLNLGSLSVVESDLVKELQDAMINQETTEARDVCTYELAFKPHLIQLNSNAKLANLLQRLENLEKVVGSSKYEMEYVLLQSGKKSLCEVIDKISSKLSLLEPQVLDQIDLRMGSLLQKLNMSKAKKELDEDLEISKKVHEAYDLVKKLEPLLVILPSVVERFQSLAYLHDHAFSVTSKLAQIEKREEQMGIELVNYAQIMNDIQNGISSSMESVQAAVQELNKRIENLSKRSI